MALEAGAFVLNRYRIVRHIGQGGMGAVYEAMDERLLNTVALKQTLVDEERLKRAFEREAQLLARLRHPALPKVIDHFVDSSGQFLVMEFIPGDDLGKLLELRSQPFPVEQVIHWTDQLLDALHYLHTQSIIHRDIKPQNLKFVENNQIILLDFGLAKGSALYQTRSQSQSSGSHSTFGYTPQYAPIEQIQSAGTDARSDLYALGATMYCLVTGAPPPSAMIRASAVIAHHPDPVRPAHEIRSEVPPAFSQALMQAMSLYASERQPDAATMRQQINQAMSGDTVVLPDAGKTVALPPDAEDERTQVISQPAFAEDDRTAVSPPVAGDTQTLTGSQQQTSPRRHLPPAGPPTAQAPTPTPAPAPRPVRIWPIVGVAGGLGGLLLVLLAALLFVVPALLDKLDGEVAGLTSDDKTATVVVQNETTTALAQNQTATAVAIAAAESLTATQTAAQYLTATAQTMALSQTATAQTMALSQTATARQEEVATFHAGQEPGRADLHLSGALDDAQSQYAPEMEALLLKNGYQQNIVTIGGLRCLCPSQTGKRYDTWVRDLDYAMRGYGAILGDMRVLHQNTRIFLANVRANGVVPETIHTGTPVYGNAWDSMPNLIHAAYGYVAKTGDREFYRTHRNTLQQVGMWIAELDSDGDALPDLDDLYPYGYYNSINNSVMHTYAVAMFYAAYRELAELERYTGYEGSEWEQRAALLRESFHKPYDEGGYWVEGLPWPIAWRREEVRDKLETFGVFEAVQSGLIAPSDGERYRVLFQALHQRLPEMLDDPTPMRLALGGYPESMLRTDANVPRWKLDASSPWIVGLAAPAYTRAGYPEDAGTLMQAYMAMARRNDGRVLQLAAGENARYGPGQDDARGLTWDTAAWFMAVYGGHYGLKMTPFALVVEPHPFQAIPDDGIVNLSYQGAVVQLSLDATAREYRIQADKPIVATLRPVGAAHRVQVNDTPPQPEMTLVLAPGEEYRVTSLESSGP
jgi:serine/threonine protein kinase